MSLTLLPGPGSVFLLLLRCLVLLWCEGFFFVLLYFVLLCLVVAPGDLLFSDGRQRGSGFGEEKSGDWEEWKEGKLWSGCIL